MITCPKETLSPVSCFCHSNRMVLRSGLITWFLRLWNCSKGRWWKGCQWWVGYHSLEYSKHRVSGHSGRPRRHANQRNTNSGGLWGFREEWGLLLETGSTALLCRSGKDFGCIWILRTWVGLNLNVKDSFVWHRKFQDKSTFRLWCGNYFNCSHLGLCEGSKS